MHPIGTYIPYIYPPKENNDLFSLFGSYRNIFVNLEILPFDKLIFNRIAITMYKYTNDMLSSVI